MELLRIDEDGTIAYRTNTIKRNPEHEYFRVLRALFLAQGDVLGKEQLYCAAKNISYTPNITLSGRDANNLRQGTMRTAKGALAAVGASRNLIQNVKDDGYRLIMPGFYGRESILKSIKSTASNVFIKAPSGWGKTELAKKLKVEYASRAIAIYDLNNPLYQDNKNAQTSSI